MREFLATHANQYVAERLRADWLRVLGKRREWTEFDRQASRYARDDLEVSCYRWLARLEREDESAGEEAIAMWLEPAELPEGCQRLSTLLFLKGRLSVTDVWRRARVSSTVRSPPPRRPCAPPKQEAPDERMLAEAARHPKRLVERLPKTLDKRPAREVAVLAAVRYARNDVSAAAVALEGPLAQRLEEADLKYLWGVVAYEGAREHHNDALKWYERAGDTPLDDRQLAWKARAALRDSRWGLVREAIDRMSFGAAHQPAWVYWYGRALGAQGEEIGSRAYFLRIAGQTDFYGLLASEELGYVLMLPDITHVPSEEELAAAAADPGLKRALELIRLGIRVEGFASGSLPSALSTTRVCSPRPSSPGATASTTAPSTPPTARRASTTSPCATRCRTRTSSAATPRRTAWTRPGCSVWCARRAASSPMRARRSARPD